MLDTTIPRTVNESKPSEDLRLQLFHEHYEDLEKSGLSEETISEARIRSIPLNEITRVLGFSIPGLSSLYEIPYDYGLSGYDNGYCRYKAFYNNGKKEPKYLQRKNSYNRLYIPEQVRKILNDPKIPLYITEGEKKSLKATQEGLDCIGLSGLWNWSNGKKELIFDFSKIALDKRKIYIVPDNDWLSPDKHGYKKNLKQAVYQLAEKLKAQGADVFIVELPQGKDKGLDDFLCNYNVEDFKNLVAIKIKSLSEKIAEATRENYRPLLQEIADVTDEIERQLFAKQLVKKIGANYYVVVRSIRDLQKSDQAVITDSNIVIAHPAYEINSDFLSLGFREVIVINDKPSDRNIYLIASQDGFSLCTDKITFQLNEQKIVFNEQGRLLIPLNDKWSKDRLSNFIKDPTSPEGLYYKIKEVLKQHLEFQKEAVYGLMSGWIIATYFHRCFNAFPFLFIHGKKQSGKSRVLDILERLSFNAMKIKGVSVASMADSIDGTRGTFLNDQAEALSDPKNSELVGILADSYTPGGGKRRVVDMSNKRRRVIEFETYSPKAFASYRDLDWDLRDRCILIPMLRAKGDYPYPEPFLPVWHEMRDKLFALLLTKWGRIREVYEISGDGVTQRVKELWRPLETVLKLEKVSVEEIQAIREFFLESMLEAQSELDDREYELFAVLSQLLEGRSKEPVTIAVADIAERMKPFSEMDKIELESQSLLTRETFRKEQRKLQAWIGRAVKRLNLSSKQGERQGTHRTYIFELEHIKDVYSRYSTNSSGLSGSPVSPLENKIIF